MADYPYSAAPSMHGPDEIDVSTIPVPANWLADPPASPEASGRLVLTETALRYLVDVLAGQRVVNLPEDLSPRPEDLSPFGMVALLDAAWVRE
jgi:hypothetical protein